MLHSVKKTAEVQTDETSYKSDLGACTGGRTRRRERATVPSKSVRASEAYSKAGLEFSDYQSPPPCDSALPRVLVPYVHMFLPKSIQVHQQRLPQLSRHSVRLDHLLEL